MNKQRLPFKSSAEGSIGVELEIQLVNPTTFDLVSSAKDLIRNIRSSPYQNRIKPEITQSMIEINSKIHQSPETLYKELLNIQIFLSEQAKKMNIYFCGGGTHPFEKWMLTKIFPTKRFKNLSRIYRYLSKRATVFGQHIHIGCKSSDDALYLTHALARYVPQLTALSASSPFYQGIDTGYCSSRTNVFASFPMGGIIPYLLNWDEFSAYFYKMKNLGIIVTMKDCYWDVRPKPEFGTVEIRVCDMPLTLNKVVLLTAYAQALALYLLKERPIVITHDLYFLYRYNLFQACRYGFDGNVIDSKTSTHQYLFEDILRTIDLIKPYAATLNSTSLLTLLKEEVIKKQNDATRLRQIFKKAGSLSNLVKEQCLMWEEEQRIIENVR